MTVRTRLKSRDDWTRHDLDRLVELKEAVYPPESVAAWPGRDREWTPVDWGVFIETDESTLSSFVGAVLREGSHDGRDVLIGGIGGVATHPRARRRGLAAAGIRTAVEFFSSHHVDFGLLVCAEHLIRYYSRLDWEPFTGTLLNTQFGEVEVFTFNEVMVRDVTAQAPITGTIDLHGPPW